MIDIFSSSESMAFYVSYAIVSVCVFVAALVGVNTTSKLRIPVLVIFFVAFLGTSYVSLGELLGRPKPVPALTWNEPNVEEATVVAQYLIEGKSINLLLMFEGTTVPRYYQFRWNNEMAEELQKAAQRQAMEANQGVKLKFPFQHTWEDRTFPEVYEIPWPAPPQKDEERNDVIDLNEIRA